MSGVLNLSQWLGGADNIKAEATFPSSQKTMLYNFDRDISGWTFEVDYQTIVVDQVAFNRNTGQPNFTNSTVIGYFPKVEVTGGFAPEVVNAALGTVKVHFPANMYTGAIIPDARKNVPITIVGITWTDDATPANINTHRWALIQSWEPDVAPGDPVLEVDYTAITVG